MEYYVDPTEMFPSTRPRTVLNSSAILRILENVFDDSPGSPVCLRDCVLVSMDIGSEYKPGPSKITSIGISTLDTRCLPAISSAVQPANLIETHLFLLTGKPIPLKSGVPQYLFGNPEQLQHNRDAVYKKPMQHLTPLDESGGWRNVILVGHNIMSDITMLRQSMGINLEKIPNVCAIVDTQRLVCDLYNFSRTRLKVSLQRTLICLGVRYMYLHNSGNDAHFTLKALLLLFCRWKGEKELYNFNRHEARAMYWEERLKTLSCIGQYWSGVIPEVRSTRKRRSKNKPKKMARDHDIWDEEFGSEADLLTVFD